MLIQLDGTTNKSNLGGNATLGVSLAVARAASHLKNLEMLIVHPYLKQIEADPLMLVDDLRQWMKKLPNRQKILNLRIREWFENASNASDFKFVSTMLTHD